MVRKQVLIVVASVVVAAGAFVAFRSWLRDRALRSELDQKVAHAAELMQSEAHLSDAAVELRQVLDRAPDHVPALLARAEVCLRLSQLKDSIDHSRHAAELTDGGDHAHALVLLGHALAAKYRGTNDDADFRGAHNAFLEARREPAFEADAMQGYAALFLEKGRNRDVEKALAVFDEFLQKHGDHPDAPAVRDLVDALRHKSGDKGG